MRLYFIIILFALISGCKDPEPKGLLPRDKMEAVLWDYLKNDIYTFEYLKDSLHDDTLINMNLQKKIFARHHVTKEQFNLSYDYYISKPKVLKLMLDSVVARQKRNDSILLKKKIVPIKGI